MKPILELKNICKRYPGVNALSEVQFTLYPGEIHALVGENGAGKSTLIKVITGAIEATSGEIWFDGKRVEKNSPAKAIELGIAAVYQEFNLVPKMTVAENIFMGRFPKNKGFTDYKRMYSQAQEILDQLGVEINAYETVNNLTVGYQQLVEIAKSVSRNVRVLIMDEPSAPLTMNEMKYLYGIVRRLKQRGVAVIYISHRMEEIFEICEVFTVFRDGHYIQTLPVAQTDKEELISLMVNRKLGNSFPPKKYHRGKKVLEVRNLSTNVVHDVSFDAYEGEILGFAGLVGAGRTEVVRAVFGADKRISGSIKIDGKDVANRSPKEAVAHGIGLIPEDRKQHGALLHMSVKNNISYASLKDLFPSGFLNTKVERERAESYVQKLSIKTPTIEQLVRNLSGGNQQKVVLAKWLQKNSRILFFDEPTRGIDVGAKQEIYQLMNDLVEQGMVIIMISSEMSELLGMSDRILVMHEGNLVGELSAAEATQERVLKLASGIKEEEGK